MKKKIIIGILVVVALVIGGGAFYGGMVYARSSNSQRTMGLGARNGTVGGRFTAGANFISGDVISKDNQSITIKDRNGSSRIVFYSTTTEVGKFISGTIDDVAVGKTVMVNGKTNTDGSVTAQSIQLRPVTQPTQ